MSQLRARVEARIAGELDQAGIKDVPEGTPARTGIADPAVRLAVSAYQEEVESWLREWRSKTTNVSRGKDIIDQMFEDFRS